jgi:hypothetical protein
MGGEFKPGRAAFVSFRNPGSKLSLFVEPKPGGKESMRLVNAGGCEVVRAEGETPTPSPGLALALANPTNSIRTPIGMMRILITVVDRLSDNKYRKTIQNSFRQNWRRCNIPEASRFGRVPSLDCLYSCQ